MSARPRPVTATFPPSPVCESRPMSHNYSLSAGSSTASLVSVLNHNSCESLRGSSPGRRSLSSGRRSCSRDNLRSKSTDGQFPRRPFSQNGSNSLSNGFKEISVPNKERSRSAMILPRHKKTQVTRHRYSTEPNTQRDNDKENEQSGDESHKKLTAWEQWVLKKALEDRNRLEKEMTEQQKKKEEEARMRAKKEKKQQEAAQNKQQWNSSYDDMVRQRTELNKQRLKAEEEIQKQKKAQALMIAEAKYKEWLDKKATEERERKRLEQEQKEQRERQKAEKLQKNKAAVEEWLVKAKSRPRPVQKGYGYCSGKLTSYYDACAYPAPSFINPNPWRPIEIPPPPKPAPKKKVVKQKWNPAKYL